ncbi:hypothetical protein MAR_027145 [Mya arenaria]|uniref:Cytochrome c oxidase subunit I n=1 Tax=Mya arenaria TaxID=6604 RepID=A0ABY7ESK6_MYAAR|nr:hypothetical protein MAR_027145 [Mya arenaria]
MGLSSPWMETLCHLPWEHTS